MRHGREGRRTRLLAGLVLVGALALSACDGDGDADAGSPSPGSGAGAEGTADADGDGTPDPTTPGTGSDAEDATGEPVAPPTAPADIEIGPGERSASGDDDVTIEGSRAAFATPSGNLACTINDAAAVCEIVGGDFRPQADHLSPANLGECTAADANAIMTTEGGPWTCIPEPILPQAVVAQGGWWVDEVDGTTANVDDLTVAVLPYGSSITAGAVTCTSAQSGITCSNSDIGRRFTLSANSYSYGGL